MKNEKLKKGKRGKAGGEQTSAGTSVARVNDEAAGRAAYEAYWTALSGAGGRPCQELEWAALTTESRVRWMKAARAVLATHAKGQCLVCQARPKRGGKQIGADLCEACYQSDW